MILGQNPNVSPTLLPDLFDDLASSPEHATNLIAGRHQFTRHCRIAAILSFIFHRSFKNPNQRNLRSRFLARNSAGRRHDDNNALLRRAQVLHHNLSSVAGQSRYVRRLRGRAHDPENGVGCWWRRSMAALLAVVVGHHIKQQIHFQQNNHFLIVCFASQML